MMKALDGFGQSADSRRSDTDHWHNHLTAVNNDGTLSYIDLFAGCGGLSLGLEKAGFRLVLAVEKSPMAAQTFYHNFIKRLPEGKAGDREWADYVALEGEEQLRRGLLVNEVGALIDSGAYLKALRDKDVDLIAGGPPCQGFSMAGRRNPGDIRNKLPWQFLNIVQQVRPKAGGELFGAGRSRAALVSISAKEW